jgi:hypothetical protein
MRHGHLKRLSKPKMGKAAVRPDIQGQGKEVHRGRSVFKRSVNPSNNWYGRCDWDNWKCKHKLRTSLRQLALADAHDNLDWEDDWWYFDDEDGDGVGPFVDPSDHVTEVAAPKKVSVLEELCAKLKAQYGTFVEAESLKACGGRFGQVQKSFLLQYGQQVCRELRDCTKSSMSLKPTSLSSGVQQRFLDAHDTLQGTLRPGFHGTSSSNFPSIFERGLLIPGQGNDLRVVNGAVHGYGIYTAKVDSPGLSWGFCRDKKMLMRGA